MAAGGTRALDELGRAGVVHTVHEYTPHEPTGVDRGRGPAWGEDAAAALGRARQLVNWLRAIGRGHSVNTRADTQSHRPERRGASGGGTRITGLAYSCKGPQAVHLWQTG